MSGGKIGVVDVGGGFRGVYAAGVKEYLALLATSD